MTGVDRTGKATSKKKLDLASYTGDFEPDEARRLRRLLHKLLRHGGFSTEQITQITNWRGRTVRRDVAHESNDTVNWFVDAAPDFDFDFDLEPTSSTVDRFNDVIEESRRPRLTRREIDDLQAEYVTGVASPDEDVQTFLSRARTALP